MLLAEYAGWLPVHQDLLDCPVVVRNATNFEVAFGSADSGNYGARGVIVHWVEQLREIDVLDLRDQ